MTDNEPENKFDQWRTACPRCGWTLYVAKMTPLALGREIDTWTELHGDGFTVPVENLEYYDTQDEVAECAGCHQRYRLEDLALN